MRFSLLSDIIINNKMPSRKYLILIIVLIASNILFGYLYVSSKVAIRNLNTQIESQKTNAKIVLFTQLFMDKVLGGNKQVSFDDRLALENAVRDLNDKDIFDSWQSFTKAKDSNEVQNDFYSLFQLLLKKITV